MHGIGCSVSHSLSTGCKSDAGVQAACQRRRVRGALQASHVRDRLRVGARRKVH
jgi:hypothetical protein